MACNQNGATRNAIDIYPAPIALAELGRVWAKDQAESGGGRFGGRPFFLRGGRNCASRSSIAAGFFVSRLGLAIRKSRAVQPCSARIRATVTRSAGARSGITSGSGSSWSSASGRSVDGRRRLRDAVGHWHAGLLGRQAICQKVSNIIYKA